MKRMLLVGLVLVGGCWPATPPVTMEIHVSPSVSAAYWAAIEDGARYWEDQTGVEFVTEIVFESPRTTTSAGVVVIEQVSDLGGFVAHATPENGGCRVRLTDNPRHTDVATVAHELGHCLGLDHVEDRRNVMYGVHWVGAAYEANAEQIEYLRGWVL